MTNSTGTIVATPRRRSGKHRPACVWEYRLLRRLRIPFGTSLLLVVEKTG
jgi:hypothetical protein